MAEENYENSDLIILEIVHALLEGTNAVRKSIEQELSFDEESGDISVYEFLDLQLMHKQLNYQQNAKLLKILFREFEYFNTLVQNLIGFYSAGKPIEIKRRSTDIKRLLEEVTTLFEGLANTKKLRIELNVIGDAVLYVDKQLMRRVFINLMDNAIKYSYESVKDERFIKIDCHRYSINNDWLISFESYGVGITPKEISSGVIFKYGRRGKLSNDRRRSGTGIGLAETKRIVDAHKGKIVVNSINKNNEAYLTTVKIILPFS